MNKQPGCLILDLLVHLLFTFRMWYRTLKTDFPARMCAIFAVLVNKLPVTLPTNPLPRNLGYNPTHTSKSPTKQISSKWSEKWFWKKAAQCHFSLLITRSSEFVLHPRVRHPGLNEPQTCSADWRTCRKSSWPSFIMHRLSGRNELLHPLAELLCLIAFCMGWICSRWIETLLFH